MSFEPAPFVHHPTDPDLVYLQGPYKLTPVPISQTPLLNQFDAELILKANDLDREQNKYTIYHPLKGRTVSHPCPHCVTTVKTEEISFSFLVSQGKTQYLDAPYQPNRGIFLSPSRKSEYFMPSVAKLYDLGVFISPNEAQRLIELRNLLKDPVHCVTEKDFQIKYAALLQNAEKGTYLIQRTNEPHCFILHAKGQEKTPLTLYYDCLLHSQKYETGIRIGDPEMFENAQDIKTIKDHLDLTHPLYLQN